MVLNSNFYVTVLGHSFAIQICEYYSSKCFRVPISETMISTSVKTANTFFLFVLEFQKLSIQLTLAVFMP